ncbi:MAG: hypothetical protein K8F30_13310 [Taibaiella sp.]|nr:hypothetical protein [Taibaiella sp.]
MMQFNHSDEKPALLVDETAGAYLQEAARWGKFISIFGIIICGLMIIGGLSFILVGSTTAAMFAAMGISPLTIGMMYVLGGLVYLYPFIALLRFSIKVKHAIAQENSAVLQQSFRFLKNHFKSIGILIIVMIFIYALMFLFLLVAGGVAAVSS